MALHYGNPSSLHREGRIGRTAIEDARRKIATELNASIGEIFFTSGGTESNNMAIKAAVRDLGVKRIISSKIEHPCVLNTLASLNDDVKVDYVRPESDGRVDPGQVSRMLETSDDKTLVSIMHVNNEIGSINDIAAIGEICKLHGAIFHSDTVQGIGYFNYDLNALNIHFLSASAHKFHGPKGIGFIYINSDVMIKPLIHGGHQERNMRAGTENIPYITGLSKAFELSYKELELRKEHISGLRAYAVSLLKQNIPQARIINPDGDNAHYKILNIAIPWTEKSNLAILNLDMAGIAVSGGSACSSGAETDSHVFKVLFPDDEIKMIRMSMSHLNTRKEIEHFVSSLKKVI